MDDTAELLIIDPQNDFCDLPPDWCPPDPADGRARAPALPVAGAHADMLRLAAFVDAEGDRIDRITVTLDSHRRVDIAHPPFWRTGDGSAVAPFTPITAAQVRAGAFVPRDPCAAARAVAYLEALQARGRYTLMVWPEHCLVGSWGHGVHAALLAALDRWETRRLRPVRTIVKGTNPWTEHYSALQAEVPDVDDPETQLDRRLLDSLTGAPRLLVAGEASSHCVRATVEDLIAYGPSGCAARIVLLTDCTSPVAGFQAQHDAFLGAISRHGVRIARSTDR